MKIMSRDKQKKTGRRKVLKDFWQNYPGLFLLIGLTFGSLFGFTLGISLASRPESGIVWFIDNLRNALPEIIFTSVFIGLFNNLYIRSLTLKEKRNRLLREARSQSRDVALTALAQIKDENWLQKDSKKPLLKGQDLRRSNWSSIKNLLNNANLDGTNLTASKLYSTSLKNASLKGAKLNRADLRSAELIGANLSYASLRGVNLRLADLTKADLRHADLTGADLEKITLVDADLRGANLSRARNFDPAKLGYDPTKGKKSSKKLTIKIDENTILPEEYQSLASLEKYRK